MLQNVHTKPMTFLRQAGDAETDLTQTHEPLYKYSWNLKSVTLKHTYVMLQRNAIYTEVLWLFIL